MNFSEEDMRSLMIDHIDGKISGELAKYVELHIEKNAEAKAEYNQLKELMGMMDNQEDLEVSEEAKSIFLKSAEEELQKPIRLHATKEGWYYSLSLKIAAAIALLVMGYVGGNWINDTIQNQIQSVKDDFNEAKELILSSLENDESASARLKGIMKSQDIERSDADIVNALIRTLNKDDNINVRIAAARALATMQNDDTAKAALISSLEFQESAAVQLQLIDILTEMGNAKAAQELKKFAEKEDILKTVKDEAQMSAFQML